MTRFRQLALALLALGGAGAAAAEIVLYENDNYSGRTFRSVQQRVESRRRPGSTTVASSAVVRGNSWSLCTDAYFRGRCVTLGPGSYPSLGSMGLSDSVSSIRELGWEGEDGWRRWAVAAARARARGALRRVQLQRRPAFRSTATSSNLDGRFNDRAQSMIVNSGTWELCNDANYGGGCQVYGPGSLRQPGRPLRTRQLGADDRRRGWAAAGGRWRRRRQLGLRLARRPVRRRQPDRPPVRHRQPGGANLDNAGFNDRASSLRVEGGYWVFCSDANFQGECRTFGPGDYPSLPCGLSNRISSGRRISGDYPYQQNPTWGDTHTQQ